MGKQLAAFFNRADAIGGLEAKIKLAVLTRITSSRAEMEPDSFPNLQLFEGAMEQLERAHAGAPRPPPIFPPLPETRPQSEELLWGVLSSLHDAMVAVFDREGHAQVAWESKSLHRRYAPEAAHGSVGDAIARKIGVDMVAGIRSVYDGAPAVTQETAMTFGDREFWLSITLSPAHTSAGQVNGVVAFVQDITARRQMETRLRESERRLREYNRVFVELVAQKNQFLADPDATTRRITETSALTLGVERVSVWLYDGARTKIVCTDLFQRGRGLHGPGIELKAALYPAYFRALTEERAVAAHDAHVDPRTSEFSGGYLKPLGIGAMLDVPLWVNGRMAGVLCHEHVGGPREWTQDEESFAYMMANFVALSHEVAARSPEQP